MLATPILLLMLIPSGFVLGWWLDVVDFRSRTRTEQLLWSTTLSMPCALIISSVLGRFVPWPVTVGLFFLLGIVCIALLTRHSRSTRGVLDRPARTVLVTLFCTVLYLWLAALPLRFGHRLYEPVFSSDWEIRLPLIQATIRDGIPPHNPFFTFHGQSPAVRYYYYWYGLCAQLGHVVHTDARSILVASSVYSLLGIVAVLFLYLKYIATSPQPLRRRCLWLLFFCCVLSMDIVPNLAGLHIWHVRMQPEIEWWEMDRSPGLPGALLFAPHHVGGLACGLLGYLSVLLIGDQPIAPSRRRVAAHGLLTALCFAALVGTSSFIVLFFTAALLLVFVDALRRRDYPVVQALALATVISLALSLLFLHESTARTVVAHGNGAGKHALRFAIRGDFQVQQQLGALLHRFHRSYFPPGLKRYASRLVLVTLHYIVEIGFFLFVIWLQFKRDVRSGGLHALHTRALWYLAGATTVFFFFVSSSPIQGVNDLGVHAGLVLRVVWILWATQVVPEYLASHRGLRRSPRQQWAFGLAVTCLVLGLLTFAWETVVDRTYLILVDQHIIPSTTPFPDSFRLSRYYNDIYEAETAAAHLLPRDAVIQNNPISRYGLVFHLYQQRRQAAGDISCEGSFGGDPAVCQSYMPGILNLFGVHPRPLPHEAAQPIDPQGSTLAAFQSLCAHDGLAAALASRADPVWFDRQSWVWQGNLLFANTNVRLIGCPQS